MLVCGLSVSLPLGIWPLWGPPLGKGDHPPTFSLPSFGFY